MAGGPGVSRAGGRGEGGFKAQSFPGAAQAGAGECNQYACGGTARPWFKVFSRLASTSLAVAEMMRW